ncbi:DUF3971 domain-containing protein [Martelella endophytica]|uniref:YhdP central domain-containing protein n=1 Tax=Martelella endophytica TaxID=1486262 RepID=A0A0D5LS14_MAREN|nr:DUF3971 domain-containing protein [Martelella endophytica]AJY46572.1 hypothetical protein TM49_14245 [Martelella endophytica]
MSGKRQKQPHIRGERTRFSRRERAAFHTFPSAQAHEPLLVHSRPHRSLSHLCVRALIFFALIAAIVFSLIFYVIESGSLDRFLAAKANEQIRAAMPEGYHARISAATLRLGPSLKLELNVSGVTVANPDDKQMAAIGTLAFAVDPVALARGQIAVNSVSADDIRFDSSALPSTGTFRLTEHRVDTLPVLVETIFQQTDFVRGILAAADTQSIELSDIAFPVGSASPGQTVAVDVRSLSLNLLPDGILRADGEVSLDGTVAGVSIEASGKDGRTESLQAEVGNIVLTPFLLRTNNDGEPALGVEGTTDVALQMTRAEEGGDPEVYAAFDLATGSFIADTIARPFTDARLNLSYDNDKHSIELTDSSIDFDGSQFPFTGGIIDLDRVDSDANDGYGLDFLVRGGRFKSREPGLPPLIFDAKATGEFRPAEPHLLLDNITVSSPQGMMAASFKAVFGEASPELSFGARIERMDTEAIKQLWPFWIARKPREWVSNNLHGGVVTNGDIAVFLPAGRLQGVGIPINLDNNELRIGFDIDDTRITLNDTFPDVNRSDAHVRIEGGAVSVDIADGSFSVGKGRTIKLENGDFTIADAYSRPVTGAVDVTLSGRVQDVLTFADAPPINALKGTDFTPDDFSGDGVVHVQASFPLEAGQSSVPENWHVAADVQNGAIAKPISGYAVSDLNGHIEVAPQQIVYKGKGGVDGIPIDIDWTQPLGKAAGGSTLVVAGALDDAQRDKLVPGLGNYVSGPMTMTLNGADNVNTISLDLTRTRLSLPWIGWSKPAGVAARLSFESTAKDGVTTLKNLNLSGEGLAATGEVTLDKGGLSAATLNGVQLGPGDDFNVALQRNGSGLDVAVTGRSFAAASLLDKLTKDGSTGGGTSGSGGENVNLHLDLARVGGEGDRYLANVVGDLSVVNGAVGNGAFTAVTATGQPLSIEVGPDNGATAVHVKTSGTGALLRFLGIYQKMSGGALTFDMIQTPQGWRGMLTLNDFDLINDEQLKRLLSTPTGKNGKSLNATVSNKINASSQHFQRAQAIVDLSDGVLRVSDAFVRGDQVGATFKGVVRDAAGNIDMTGTFMPAYGLNRIFAEIPLIGPILGNGQDKGLFGITFKLTGKTEKPELVINPLSAIAPGVFRRIFEFQ